MARTTAARVVIAARSYSPSSQAALASSAASGRSTTVLVATGAEQLTTAGRWRVRARPPAACRCFCRRAGLPCDASETPALARGCPRVPESTSCRQRPHIGMSGHRRAARPGQPPTRGQMHMILSVVTALASPSLRTAVPGRLLHVCIGVLTRRMASATGECTLRHRAGCRAVGTRAVTSANRRAVLRQPHCCSLCLLHRTQRRSGRHRGSGNPRLR